MKGTLHKTESGWMVEYKKSIQLDDDEAQYEGKRYVFNKEYLPLHPEDESIFIRYSDFSIDWDGLEIEFEWSVIVNAHGYGCEYARLTKPNSSSKIVKLQDGVNLEEIPKDQIEKERNPAYKYFDIKEKQKKLISEIMEEDAKDGLYEIPDSGKDTADYIDRHIIESMKELAKEGHLKNIEIPELSDEELEKLAEKEYPYDELVDTDYKGMIVSAERAAWIDGIKWFREQIKNYGRKN